MSAPLLSLKLGEVFRLHPALAAFINGADGGAAKPGAPLSAWIEGLSEENLGRLGMAREEIAGHLDALAAQADSLRRAPKGIGSLRIFGGRDKSGREEKLDLTLLPGEITCIVGPTGSGKSRLLADIECLAQGDTPSGRRIWIDGEEPDPARRWAVSGKLVAQLSQNMNFVVDLTVGEFIAMHADCRGVADREAAARDVIACANQLAGEKFTPETSLTQLSGGQSRALMIADVALLSVSPIVLIDEIENAGIDRKRALDLLVASDKIVLMSTHDPILALLGERRVIVANGAVAGIVETGLDERGNLATLELFDTALANLREKLRRGGRIDTLPKEFSSFVPTGPGPLEKIWGLAWTR
jgi:ABC-type lipoprotein export system ATPase subunit